ncbi:MAG: tetratricopeptide repeat protein [Bacteroidota bacterium]
MRLVTLTFFLFSSLIFSQSKEGFWDNIRTTNETFVVKSGDKKLLASADFPVGTTEVVFRITLLDDNQKISSSLVSVLKSIPDPTGISQGAAGGVFLLSTISGEDKCKYSIFTSSNDAENYIKTGKAINACFTQNTPINKEVKLLASDSKCLASNPKKLYFVFESDNWILKEKIVLEIVPWVNTKLSRGWNTNTKNELLQIATSLDWTKKLTKKDQFYALFVENIQSKYTYSEFKQLIAVEKSRATEVAIEESLKKSGEIDKYFNTIRDQSLQLFKQGKTEAAIDLIKVEMIAKNRATYKDYGALGDYHLLTKQFSKAEGYYNQGLQLNPTEIVFQLNLAHVYMFTNRLQEAKDIHKKYGKENLSIGKSWTEQTKTDFKEFEKRQFPTNNFKKILRILE